LIYGDIRPEIIDAVRSRMAVFEHRRSDLY
jgi:hypothetical protein